MSNDIAIVSYIQNKTKKQIQTFLTTKTKMVSFHTHTFGRGIEFVSNQWYMCNIPVILSMYNCIFIASNFSADIYGQGCVNKSLV